MPNAPRKLRRSEIRHSGALSPFPRVPHAFRSPFCDQTNMQTNMSHGNTHFHLCALVGPFAYWAMHSTRTSKHDVAPTLRRTYASAHVPTHTTRAVFMRFETMVQCHSSPRAAYVALVILTGGIANAPRNFEAFTVHFPLRAACAMLVVLRSGKLKIYAFLADHPHRPHAHRSPT